MSPIIAFDLSCSEKQIISQIARLAVLNQIHLANSSIITQYREVTIEPAILEIFQKNSIPILPYSNKEELDQHLMLNHASFLFRICSQLPAIIPLSSPIIACGPDEAKHGNVFYTDWNGELDDANLVEQFLSRAVKPGLSIIPTIGILGNSGTAVIFIGSKHQNDLTLIRSNAMRNSNKLDPKQSRFISRNGSLNNASQNEQKTKQISAEAKSESTICPSISALKQTLNSILSKTNNKTRIKMVCNWTHSKQLLQDWSHMINGSSPPSNIEWVTDGVPDYWVVINKPPETETIDPKRTIVFRMEPYIDNILFYNDWLTEAKKSDFMYFLDHANHRNNTEWWLKLPFSELSNPIQKTLLFSTVTSSQYKMEGHRLRVDFIKFFKSHSNIPLDVFGHDNSHQFQNYKGSLPLRQKDAGILPYRYHFASENSDIPNYMTEKFFDAILGECLLFYWGCSNVSEHVDDRAFIRLDLHNFPASVKIIEDTILSNEWEKRLPIIREEKKRIMHLFNPFVRISALLQIKDIKCVQICDRYSAPQTIPGINVYHLTPPENMQIMPALVRNHISSKISIGKLVRLVRHCACWSACVRENKPFLIFDGIPASNFLDHLSEVWAMLECSDVKWDMIALQWKPDDKTSSSPQRNAVLNSLGSCFIDPTKLNDNNDNHPHGKVGSGYILNPQSAKRLMDFANTYGFLTCLDKTFLSIFALIHGWKTWIVSKDLIIPESEEFIGEICHIFRKSQTGEWNTIVPPFTWPPANPNPEVQLIPESKINIQT